MIADGTQRGYAEVRVAMSRRGARLPDRPWRKRQDRRVAQRPANAPAPDWASSLRELAGAPPMARADATASPALQQSGEAFRAMIAEERQRELEYSRYMRAKERQA